MRPAAGRLAALLVAMALGAAACGRSGSGPSSSTALTPTQAAVANVCGPNPAPHPPNLQPTDFGYRTVSQPNAGDPVTSPLQVSGQANPFEGAFSVSVFGANGNLITARDFIKSNLQLAFAVQVPFTVTAPTPACVWVHARSGNDGSPVNVTQIPVQLLP